MKLIKDLGVIDGRRKGIYECSSCGKHIERRTSHVKASKTTECQACLMSKKFKTHGDTGTRLHNIWLQMRLRCTDTNNSAYRWYGAKGIKVDEEWETYETFKDWAINNGYTEELTIERINSDKNYERSNCKWIPIEENRQRARDKRKVKIDRYDLGGNYIDTFESYHNAQKETGISFPNIRRVIDTNGTAGGYKWKKSLEK